MIGKPEGKGKLPGLEYGIVAASERFYLGFDSTRSSADAQSPALFGLAIDFLKINNLGGDYSKIFICTPKMGEDERIFDEHIFQMGC